MHRYTLIGDRSKTALQSLYPPGHENLVKLRFKTEDTNKPVGWAVLTVAKMKNHKYFGNMTLAALADMLAVPGEAYYIVSGALITARRAKADLIIVSHSDHRWNGGLQASRYAAMEKRFMSIYINNT